MKKMKLVNWIIALMTVIAVFTCNALMGSNDFEGASIEKYTEYVVENHEPIYAMALTGVDITQLNLELGAFMKKKKNEIFTALFQDIELENFMNSVPDIQDEYEFATSTSSELLQPFQCDFTPKGEVQFQGRLNKVRQIKMDYVLDCIDDIQRSWIGFLADEGKSRKDWPLVKFIVTNHLIPQIREEIDDMSYNGVFAAPIPGTPGASLTSTDGLGTQIATFIGSGDLVPIAVPAVTPTNILDGVETFCDGLPNKYKKLRTPILMSKTNEIRYWRDYRANFGTNSNYTGKDNLRVDATNKEIIGLNAMEGSDRFIHTTKRNLIKMYDKVIIPKGFVTETEKRAINIMADFKRGYGWRLHEEMFVSDNV